MGVNRQENKYDAKKGSLSRSLDSLEFSWAGNVCSVSVPVGYPQAASKYANSLEDEINDKVKPNTHIHTEGTAYAAICEENLKLERSYKTLFDRYQYRRRRFMFKMFIWSMLIFFCAIECTFMYLILAPVMPTLGLYSDSAILICIPMSALLVLMVKALAEKVNHAFALKNIRSVDNETIRNNIKESLDRSGIKPATISTVTLGITILIFIILLVGFRVVATDGTVGVNRQFLAFLVIQLCITGAVFRVSLFLGNQWNVSVGDVRLSDLFEDLETNAKALKRLRKERERAKAALHSGAVKKALRIFKHVKANKVKTRRI